MEDKMADKLEDNTEDKMEDKMADKTEESTENADELVPGKSPSNEGQNKVPSHTSQATVHYPPSGGFNPCGCCNAGNLRKSCCFVAAIEIGWASQIMPTIYFIPFMVFNFRGLAAIVVYVGLGVSFALSIGMPTALCCAIHKVSKAACVIHSILAGLSALLVLTVIIAVVVLFYHVETGINTLGIRCNPDNGYYGDRGNRNPGNNNGGSENQDVSYDYVNEDADKKERITPTTVPPTTTERCIQTSAEQWIFIVCVFCGTLFLCLVYAMVASIGLYTKFKAGVLYDGTDLSCRGWCRPRYPVAPYMAGGYTLQQPTYSAVGYPTTSAAYLNQGYPVQGNSVYMRGGYPYRGRQMYMTPSYDWSPAPHITVPQQVVAAPPTTTTTPQQEVQAPSTTTPQEVQDQPTATPQQVQAPDMSQQADQSTS